MVTQLPRSIDPSTGIPFWFTPQQDLYNIMAETRFGFISPTESYDRFHDFPPSSEGSVGVVRSKASGRLFVLKHTTAIPLRNSPERTQVHEDPPGFKVNNEARILLSNYRRPHLNIGNALAIRKNFSEPGRWWIWTGLCSGGDLHDQMMHFVTSEWDGYPPALFLLHLFCGLADGLAFLHHGIRRLETGTWTVDEKHRALIHGDIKLENIFLRWTERSIAFGMPDIVIGDFGAAKRVDEVVCDGWGTSEYWAPEDLYHTGGLIHGSWEARHIFDRMVNLRTTAVDVYPVGQIMAIHVNRCGAMLRIGVDPEDPVRGVRINERYEGIAGLREAIVRCLAVYPQQRAVMNFAPGVGLMPVIETLRAERDYWVRRSDRLQDDTWARPPGLL